MTLLALNDDGAPFYDKHNVDFLASNDVRFFACSPDLFPELMATALSKQDVAQWAGVNGLKMR